MGISQPIRPGDALFVGFFGEGTAVKAEKIGKNLSFRVIFQVRIIQQILLMHRIRKENLLNQKILIRDIFWLPVL